MGAGHRPPGRPPGQQDIPLVTWARLVRGGLLARLTPTQRDVLAVIVAHTSQDGKAYPAASTIARLVHRTPCKIYGALKALVAAGVLERCGYCKRRGENARGPVIYRILSPPMYFPERSTSPRDTPGAPGTSPREVDPTSLREVPPTSITEVPPTSPREVLNGTSERNPERKKLTEAVRFASPSETATLTAPENGDGPNPEGPALEGKNGEGPGATFRGPSRRTVTIEESIRDADRFGYGDATLARSLGLPVEIIKAQRAEMVARPESITGSHHTQDSGPVEIGHQEGA
jgi:hypothetical protein